VSEHYYTPNPKGDVREFSFSQTIRDVAVTFTSASGIFSLKHVDSGSHILIEYALIQPNWRVLDLGCGYGPVGVVLKKVEPTLEVVFTDVNKRAVVYAKKNAEQNSISSGVSFVHGDGFAAVTGLFHAIYLNPPQSAGKELCFSLIERSKEFLLPGGLLHIVARKNKGGESLSQKMKDVFGNVSVLAKKGGFWVYVSAK